MQPTTPTKPLAKKTAVFLAMIVLFSLIGTVALSAAFTVTDDIYGGVKVGDIEVGGLSERAAEQKIAAAFREWTGNPPITLVYKDQRWTITAQDIDLAIDTAALAREAYAIGRTGNIFYRLQERYMAINSGQTVPLAVTYDTAKLHAKIAAIARAIDHDPVNAKLRLNNLTVISVSEASGFKLDMAKTLGDIARRLNTKLPFVIHLPVEEIKPTVTVRDLEGIDGVIASYTTYFNPGDQNRSENIAIAAKNVDGTLLRRNEVFSFNNLVGPRLAQHGYKIAPVFINGRLVPDWGGGVCQVSSTIYNTALLADLAIEERTPHYRPPAYVPLGQDATVADNALDFKFRNNSSHNIYIICDVSDSRINVYFLGRLTADPAEIHIVAANKKVWEPNTIIKQDPKLELGKEVVEEEGDKGFQVTTYRVKYRGGREVHRELLFTDEYKPSDRILRVGTKTPVAKK